VAMPIAQKKESAARVTPDVSELFMSLDHNRQSRQESAASLGCLFEILIVCLVGLFSILSLASSLLLCSHFLCFLIMRL